MLQHQLSRKVYFSAAHRYENPDWSAKKNVEAFGACFLKHGHGHNYILEATVSGPLDASTGMIINLAALDAELKAVVEPLDHKLLNADIPYFQKHIPTTERIALYCFEQLDSRLKGLKLNRVRIYENDDLWAEVLDED